MIAPTLHAGSTIVGDSVTRNVANGRLDVLEGRFRLCPDVILGSSGMGTSNANARVALAAGVLAGCAVVAQSRARRPHFSVVDKLHVGVGLRVAGEDGNDDITSDADLEGLPTDAELRRALNARLPPEVRIPREAAFRAEQTLKRADDKIAALGIDLGLTAEERSGEEGASESVEAANSPLDLRTEPRVLICGVGSNAEPVSTALCELLTDATARWLDLRELGGLPKEDVADEVEARLQGCTALVACPSADVEASLPGFAELMRGLTPSVTRVVLLADSAEGATSGEDASPLAFLDAVVFGRRPKSVSATKPLEDLLTVTARERGANSLLGPPLDVTIVRATLGSTSQPPKVLAKLPSTVRDATSGLRSMYIGGMGAMAPAGEEQSADCTACVASIVAALGFAVREGVDVSEFTVVGCDAQGDASDWSEIMLPLIGPELWRTTVKQPGRTRMWIRGWVEFNFCRGSNRNSTIQRRTGLRTPVEVRQTTLGTCLKFMPPGAREPGVGFDGLCEGGLEILVDDACAGLPGRLRVRRCAYGIGKRPRESSERAILSQLKRDWETTQSFAGTD